MGVGLETRPGPTHPTPEMDVASLVCALASLSVWWRHREWAPFPGYPLAWGPRRSPAAPPPPPSPHPHTFLKNLKKLGFKWGGLGESGPKTHWGMCLLDKMMILQGVKLTIQPLGVGYANRPKKAQNGGGGRFPLYIPAWL